MTITYIGVGTAPTANNASVQPTIHASSASGDLMFCYTWHRNTAATTTTPPGWSNFSNFGNINVFYKYHSGAESAPTITFSGGAAGDDCGAQIATFRGANAYKRLHFGNNNASAQNIAIPASTPGRANCLVLTVGWKQDDWTSVATLTGNTEISEMISTAGNDSAAVWSYQIQTTAAATAAGPFTVTGGAAAVSKSILMTADMAAVLTVTPQDAYPPRNLVSITDLVLGDTVELYRVVAGERTLVRGGSSSSVTDTSFVRVDDELPYGVPVSYVAVVSGNESYTSPQVTYTLTGSKVALSDAIGGASAEVVILNWPESAYDRDASRFKVGGRNVVVSGDLGMWEGTIEFYVETTSARDNVLDLFDTATEGVVQLRQPGGYENVDCFFVPLTVRERRFSQDGSDPRRVLAVDAVQVEGWASTLDSPGYTLQDVADAYNGATLDDIDDDYATLLALAQGDFS